MHEQLLSFQSSILSAHTLFFCSACRHGTRQSRHPRWILVHFSSSLGAHGVLFPVGRLGGRPPCQDWLAASLTRRMCECVGAKWGCGRRTWRLCMSRTVLRGRVDEATFVSAGEPAEERGEDMVYGLLWGTVADAMLMIYEVWMYYVPHSELAERGTQSIIMYLSPFQFSKRSSKGDTLPFALYLEATAASYVFHAIHTIYSFSPSFLFLSCLPFHNFESVLYPSCPEMSQHDLPTRNPLSRDPRLPLDPNEYDPRRPHYQIQQPPPQQPESQQQQQRQQQQERPQSYEFSKSTFQESWRPTPRESYTPKRDAEPKMPKSSEESNGQVNPKSTPQVPIIANVSDTGLPTPSLTAQSSSSVVSSATVNEFVSKSQAQSHEDQQPQASGQSPAAREIALDSLAKLRQFKAEVEATRQIRGGAAELEPAKLAKMAESFILSQQQQLQLQQPHVQTVHTIEEEKDKIAREQELKGQLKARAKGDDSRLVDRNKDRSSSSSSVAARRPRAEDLIDSGKSTSDVEGKPDLRPSSKPPPSAVHLQQDPRFQRRTPAPVPAPPPGNNFEPSAKNFVPSRFQNGKGGVPEIGEFKKAHQSSRSPRSRPSMDSIDREKSREYDATVEGRKLTE